MYEFKEELEVIASFSELSTIGATGLHGTKVQFSRFHKTIFNRIYVIDSKGQEWWVITSMVRKVNTKPFEGDLEFDIYV